ncbi:hypothetical protein ACFSJQ_22125 [Vibrio olivae]|uniref:Uncharacterized protein n=1 Tax=Vibrio olivae TaxID=1243002 RepID=A0ABV5HPJ4_9VIBR
MMKTLTKTALVAAVAVVSTGVYAHMNAAGQRGDMGNVQSGQMMHGDWKAMQDWHEKMQNDPQAREAWMANHHNGAQMNSAQGIHCPMAGQPSSGQASSNQ